jgi:microcystin-dependent protein
MPSTYSPSLRLELIGNGEQAANWGNTTNTNLGTLLEQAITGVGNITMAGTSVTLVSGAGVADEARNAVLVLGGTLSASCNLIVPTANKFYAVRNATTGSQNVVVKTSAGTGVTLVNGYTQLMYCDGTNVVFASVPINSTDGSVLIGGNLVVNGSITSTSAPIVPTGVIMEYGGISAPLGWLLCNGSAVSRTTYATLFAVLGTAYGAGDGTTTFNVPNRNDRVGVGAGSSYARGTTGGAATATTSTNGLHAHNAVTGDTAITTAQMPSHVHDGGTSTVGDHTHGFSSNVFVYTPGSGQPGYQNGSYFDPGIDTIGSTNGAGSHAHSFTTNSAGNGQTHNHSIIADGLHDHSVSTIQPYIASNYIIKA